MDIKHHPDASSLMSCSAGSMPEAFAAVMASHIAMCPGCRRELAAMEDIGVAMFEDLSPGFLSRPAPVIALRASEADVEFRRPSSEAGDVPPPLQAVVGPHLDHIPWRRVAPGVWQHQIALNHPERGDLRLIKVSPGMALPEHGHRGHELTLVLRGAYSDASGTYRAGDVADLDENIEHQPIADPVEGCICLIAVDGKLKFKSRIARLVQPLMGF
jgi:putative transcriptional regulator